MRDHNTLMSGMFCHLATPSRVYERFHTSLLPELPLRFPRRHCGCPRSLLPLSLVAIRLFRIILGAALSTIAAHLLGIARQPSTPSPLSDPVPRVS
jgi:hypothetical protein